MGWELPLALAGAVLAGLPVIVHLIRRRDLPTVPLPTLALLQQARVRSRRRLHLVDLLLLLVRMLLIALLAVAVAGPFVLTEVAWGEGRTASVTVVLDDSMSMGRSRDGTTLLARAAERTRDIVTSLPAGSEVAVVLAGKPARVLVPLTSDLETARERLDAVSSRTARGTALADAVARATRELGGARHGERALVVLSDFAQHAVSEDIRWPEHVPTSVERIGERAPEANRAVTEVTAAPDPTQPHHASLRLTVRAFDTEDSSTEVVVRQGGAEVARKRVELSRGRGLATVTVPLPESGDPTAHVELAEDDPLGADDTRGVVLRAPNAVRVLVVDGDPHPSRLQGESAFLDQAFRVAPREEGTIVHRTIDPDTLDPRALARVDLLILANVPAPGGPTAEAIRDFVERGGGLWITPGPNAEPRAYAARLSSLLPAHPNAVASGPEKPGLSPGEPSSLLSDGGGGLAEVRTRRRWAIEPSRTDAEVLLRFADGAPALVGGRLGEGRTAILATSVDDDWTDLPYRPGFVPLVMQLTRGLAPSARLPERPFEPGTVLPIPVGPGVTHLRVITPEGDQHDFRGADLGETVRFEDTDQPGAYRVQMATESHPLRDDPRAAFVMAPPLAESDLSPGELPQVGEPAATRQARTENGLVRRSLAPWLFLAAGLLALLEAWLRRPRAFARGSAREAARAG
ncbi:MAG: VWA domain-containing protein [Myxococcota bacterium]